MIVLMPMTMTMSNNSANDIRNEDAQYHQRHPHLFAMSALGAGGMRHGLEDSGYV
jgi:hypothetical protein